MARGKLCEPKGEYGDDDLDDNEGGDERRGKGRRGTSEEVVGSARRSIGERARGPWTRGQQQQPGTAGAQRLHSIGSEVQVVGCRQDPPRATLAQGSPDRHRPLIRPHPAAHPTPAAPRIRISAGYPHQHRRDLSQYRRRSPLR